MSLRDDFFELDEFSPLLSIVMIFAFLIAITGAIVFLNMNSNSSVGKACTEEAMICPDGSAVGRTGPNCEFSPCP